MPRRRIVRASPLPSEVRSKAVLRVREKLFRERVQLERWLKRLMRAVNALKKHQSRVARLERRIRHLEDS